MHQSLLKSCPADCSLKSDFEHTLFFNHFLYWKKRMMNFRFVRSKKQQQVSFMLILKKKILILVGSETLYNHIHKSSKFRHWHSLCDTRLVVTATDRGTPRLAGSATLTVIIIDLNDNSPMIPLHREIRVPEGKSASQWKLVQWSYHKASLHTPRNHTQWETVRKVLPCY